MQNKTDNMFTSSLKKENGKLVYFKPSDNQLYKLFVDSLAEGQTVEVFFDANIDDGTLAQLAKIHKCIREIAKETGAGFEETKKLVTKKAGLCFEKEINGETKEYYKSFSIASKAELSSVIETIMEISDLLGINLF